MYIVSFVLGVEKVLVLRGCLIFVEFWYKFLFDDVSIINFIIRNVSVYMLVVDFV